MFTAQFCSYTTGAAGGCAAFPGVCRYSGSSRSDPVGPTILNAAEGCCLSCQHPTASVGIKVSLGGCAQRCVRNQFVCHCKVRSRAGEFLGVSSSPLAQQSLEKEDVAQHLKYPNQLSVTAQKRIPCLLSIKHLQRVARLMVRNTYRATFLKRGKSNEQEESKNLDSRPR